MLFIPVVLRDVVVQNISAIYPSQALEKYDFSRIVSQSDPAYIATTNIIAHYTDIKSQPGITMTKPQIISKNNPARRGNGLFYPRLIVG
ncbi:hypothetical protein [Vibrio spartinae]|uniref:hypothetical protein n=1 Tax=Vibrio spartinae TaxID=1918945 RepID=UPI0015F78E34|nr:hypothetical protein [Vibrio spartinae]